MEGVIGIPSWFSLRRLFVIAGDYHASESAGRNQTITLCTAAYAGCLSRMRINAFLLTELRKARANLSMQNAAVVVASTARLGDYRDDCAAAANRCIRPTLAAEHKAIDGARQESSWPTPP
jgi:hypothetical protein